MTFLKPSARNLFVAGALGIAAPLAIPTAAAAQAITPGLIVVDPAGNTVATVISVNGTDIVIKTDRHEVKLPSSSFTPHKGKLLFAMTRDQLNAATDQALAAAQASLAAGAEVHGSAGGLIGHIDAIDDATVTVKLLSGESVRLPRSGVAPGPNGAVIGVTAEELKTLAAQAAAGQ